MISVKVSYTVKAEYVVQNKQNISAFLADFKKLSTAGFLCNVYLQQDGLTFLHISMYESEEVQTLVLNVPSFLKFQSERDEIGLANEPEITYLDLVGSSLSLI